MKPGKGSKHQIRYQSFCIRSFPYARRPWLCRKRGRHITKSPPSFQYEKCLFGYHTTFSPRFLSGNACHHILYYRILVHLDSLNSAVRQLLVSLRSFRCSIFVFCSLCCLQNDRNDVEEAISSPDLPCQHFVVEEEPLQTTVRVSARRREHGLDRNDEGMI